MCIYYDSSSLLPSPPSHDTSVTVTSAAWLRVLGTYCLLRNSNLFHFLFKKEAIAFAFTTRTIEINERKN